jgi:peroxiredoxin
MAATRSLSVALGEVAPAFELPDVLSGTTVSLATFSENTALLVMFLSPHCPYVRHVQRGVAAMARDYRNSPLGILAISSNDAARYPDDSPKGMRRMARSLEFSFPFCHDESQEVAKAYQAICTPDFFLYDQHRRLVYHGQFDNSRPGSQVAVDGRSLRSAIDAALAGHAVALEQRPSVGSSLKWIQRSYSPAASA